MFLNLVLFKLVVAAVGFRLQSMRSIVTHVRCTHRTPHNNTTFVVQEPNELKCCASPKTLHHLHRSATSFPVSHALSTPSSTSHSLRSTNSCSWIPSTILCGTVARNEDVWHYCHRNDLKHPKDSPSWKTPEG